MAECKKAQNPAFPEFEGGSATSGDFDDAKAERELTAYFNQKRKQAEMDLRKRAEIIKRIQSHFHRALPSLNSEEPDLDKETLAEMAKCPGEAMGSMGSLGMVLKPREYQRMSLCSAGHRGLADELEGRGQCFRPRGGPGNDIFPFSPLSGRDSLLEHLAPLIEGRSGLYPPLKRRVTRIVIVAKPKSDMGDRPIDHPCMDQLADGYAGYRQRLLRVLPRLVQFLFRDHPSMVERVCGPDAPDQVDDPLADQKGRVLQSVFGMFPSMYFNRAHLSEPVSKALDARPTTSGLEREQLEAD
jgi:hypothetical protein